MFRDIVLAMLFGTSALLSNFMVAFRLSNFFRRVLAESPLSASFIPTLESFRKESEKKGALYFRDAFISLFVLGVIVTSASQLGLKFFAHHFFQKEILSIISLIQIMFPSLIFLMLYGLCSSYLQSFGKFFIGAVAPTLFNVVWIVFAYFAKDLRDESAMQTLSWGVLSAFCIQFFITALFVFQKVKIKISKQEFIKSPYSKNSISSFFKPYFLSMTGVGATQLNTFLDSIFSKIADQSGPAYLWYAIRLEQVPLSLFAIALASALLPQLSRAFQSDQKEFKALLSKSLSKNFILMSFCSVGLILFGFSVIRLIFYRGEFDQSSLQMTLRCLWAYSLGLVFQGGVIILSQAFYASKDFKTPARSAALAVVLNVICNALLIFYFEFGSVSIALATSLASLVQFIYLKVKISRQMAIFYGKNAVYGFVSVIVAGILAFFSMIVLNDPTVKFIKSGTVQILSFSNVVMRTIFSAGLFAAVFLALAWMFRIEEIKAIFKRI